MRLDPADIRLKADFSESRAELFAERPNAFADREPDISRSVEPAVFVIEYAERECQRAGYFVARFDPCAFAVGLAVGEGNVQTAKELSGRVVGNYRREQFNKRGQGVVAKIGSRGVGADTFYAYFYQLFILRYREFCRNAES